MLVMEDTSKIQTKVAKPAATAKRKDDGMVLVEYTRESVKYPMTARIPKALAKTLEKSGKLIIKEQ